MACVLAVSIAAACSRAPAPDASVAAASTMAATGDSTNRDNPGSQPDDVRTHEGGGVMAKAFHANESVESLQERFGPSNVRVEDIPGAEGEVSHGVVLFPDDPARRAYLHFLDAENLQGLAMVRVVDSQSTWTLGNDIRMGTTLADLVARNGAPIEFSGFGWDYGGAIGGFRGGKLEPRDGAWPRPAFRLSPRDGMDPNAKLPLGDGTFSSDDPKFTDLANDIVVGELTLAFPRQAPPSN
jgi:hypothetical protein